MNRQMKYGEVIRAVGSVPAETPVRFDTGLAFGYPYAYRGYHDEVAINGYDDRTTTAGEALVSLAAILGIEIGESEYEMTGETPVWHSEHGEVESLAVIGYAVNDNGELVFSTEYRDW